MLRDTDGRERTDVEGKKEILTTYFKNCWTDTAKLQGEIPNWSHRRWNTEVLDAYPVLDGSTILAMALKAGKGKACANDRVAIEMILALD